MFDEPSRLYGKMELFNQTWPSLCDLFLQFAHSWHVKHVKSVTGEQGKISPPGNLGLKFRLFQPKDSTQHRVNLHPHPFPHLHDDQVQSRNAR